ncbi:MAG: hypothetical protein WBQ72_22165 [Terriglobales bacterium]|jgi:hypothetical protein
MNYLQPSEYELYGLEATTDVAWITGASAIVDSHCRRATLAANQYTERLRTDGQRPVRLTYLPLTAVAPATSAIVSARARYAVPRRGEWAEDELSWNVALAFGIPGSWLDLNVADLDYFGDTGEVTLPLNALSFAFDELEIVYTAGWATFPDAVKVACAQIAKNAQATPGLNVKKGVMNNMQLWYFADTLLDDTVRELLAPYVAQKVG